jgi:hypothetical protein
MDSKARVLFDTTHEELTRQVDIVETYREILSDAINVHLSAISNKINLSIKGLTVIIFYLTIVYHGDCFPKHRRHILWNFPVWQHKHNHNRRSHSVVYCFAVHLVVAKELVDTQKARLNLPVWVAV